MATTKKKNPKKKIGPKIKSKSRSLTKNEKDVGVAETNKRAATAKRKKAREDLDRAEYVVKHNNIQSGYTWRFTVNSANAHKKEEAAAKKLKLAKKKVKADTKSAKLTVPYKTKSARNEAKKIKEFGPQRKGVEKPLSKNEKGVGVAKTKQRTTQRKVNKTQGYVDSRADTMRRAENEGKSINRGYNDRSKNELRKAKVKNDAAKKSVSQAKNKVKADTKKAKSTVPYKTAAAKKRALLKQKKKKSSKKKSA